MKIPGKSLEALENFNDPCRNLKKFPQNPGKAAYSVTMYFKSEFLRDWGSRDPRVLKFSPNFFMLNLLMIEMTSLNIFF